MMGEAKKRIDHDPSSIRAKFNTREVMEETAIACIIPQTKERKARGKGWKDGFRIKEC